MVYRELAFLGALAPAVGILSCAPVSSPGGDPFPVDTTGLVAYWNFDEGSGFAVRDHWVRRLDGLIIGSPVWKDGVRGKAMEFNGIGTYVELPQVPELSRRTFTVLAWVNPSDYGPGDRVIFSSLVSTVPPQETTAGFEFRFREDMLDFTFARASYQGIWFEFRQPALVLDGQWHLVAATMDLDSISLWMDTNWIGKAAYSGVMELGNTIPMMGACRGNYSDQGYFRGRIDEVAFYNRVLNADEIRRYYERFKPLDGLNAGERVR